MTEQEWLASDDPDAMWRHLIYEGDGEPRAVPLTSLRKLRLCACVSVRRIWRLVRDERSRAAVEVAERHADSEATADELVVARLLAWTAWQELYDRRRRWRRRAADVAIAIADVAAAIAAVGVADAADAIADAVADAADVAAVAEREAQADLLRDIVGNPFHPVLITPTCITPTVVTLAQAAYDERTLPAGELNMARLAVLSDALEEAGCADDAILSHLRSAGPHVRGCWALDLILGKE